MAEAAPTSPRARAVVGLSVAGFSRRRVLDSIPQWPFVATMRLAALLVIALWLSGISGSHSRADTIGPSFDCTRAQLPAERIVCANPTLSARDLWLDLTYRDALALALDKTDAMQADERHWIENRDKLCGLPEASRMPDNRNRKAFTCLLPLYDERISTLAAKSFEALFRDASKDPARALAKLQPLHSPLARVYAGLLAHVISGESGDSLDNFRIDLVDQIHRSDLWMAAPVQGIEIPCSLVDRFPRLLVVAQSTYGSTKDLELPDFDCRDDVPEPPASVSAFIGGEPSTYQFKFDSCPDRAGTYFTSVGHELSELRLRLVRFPRSYLTKGIGPSKAPDDPWPPATVIDETDWGNHAAFAAAKHDLAVFYERQYKIGRSDAETAAARALWDATTVRGSTDATSCRVGLRPSWVGTKPRNHRSAARRRATSSQGAGRGPQPRHRLSAITHASIARPCPPPRRMTSRSL